MSSLRVEELEPRQLLSGVNTYFWEPCLHKATGIAVLSATFAEPILPESGSGSSPAVSLNKSIMAAIGPAPICPSNTCWIDGKNVQVSLTGDSSLRGSDFFALDKEAIGVNKEEIGFGNTDARLTQRDGFFGRVDLAVSQCHTDGDPGYTVGGSLSVRGGLQSGQGMAELFSLLASTYPLPIVGGAHSYSFQGDSRGGNYSRSLFEANSSSPLANASVHFGAGGSGEVAPKQEEISPHISGILTALSPRNLAKIEEAVEKFLQELALLGQPMNGNGDQGELHDWVIAGAAMGTAIAGAAAAAAFEMARGAVKSQSSQDLLDLDWHFNLPSDGLGPS